MDSGSSAVATALERTVIRFFSPDGLFTAVALIVLTVLLLGGTGIERRMMDDAAAEPRPAAVSPLLHNAR